MTNTWSTKAKKIVYFIRKIYFYPDFKYNIAFIIRHLISRLMLASSSRRKGKEKYDAKEFSLFSFRLLPLGRPGERERNRSFRKEVKFIIAFDHLLALCCVTCGGFGHVLFLSIFIFICAFFSLALHVTLALLCITFLNAVWLTSSLFLLHVCACACRVLIFHSKSRKITFIRPNFSPISTEQRLRHKFSVFSFHFFTSFF